MYQFCVLHHILTAHIISRNSVQFIPGTTIHSYASLISFVQKGVAITIVSPSLLPSFSLVRGTMARSNACDYCAVHQVGPRTRPPPIYTRTIQAGSLEFESATTDQSWPLSPEFGSPHSSSQLLGIRGSTSLGIKFKWVTADKWVYMVVIRIESDKIISSIISKFTDVRKMQNLF